MVDLTNSVQPLVALTLPIPNTKLEEAVWFCCTIPNASMHRADGKKLPFVQGFCKVIFAEDLEFLQNEVDGGNPYIRKANAQEREQARMLEDPLGAIKDNLRDEVMKDVVDSFTIDDLEALLAKRRAADVNQRSGVVQVEGAAGGQGPLMTQPIPANETPAQKTARLQGTAAALARQGKINPGSTETSPTGQSTSKS